MGDIVYYKDGQAIARITHEDIQGKVDQGLARVTRYGDVQVAGVGFSEPVDTLTGIQQYGIEHPIGVYEGRHSAHVGGSCGWLQIVSGGNGESDLPTIGWCRVVHEEGPGTIEGQFRSSPEQISSPSGGDGGGNESWMSRILSLGRRK